LSHYCASSPSLVAGTRAGVRYYGLEFFTRAYPCFTELYLLFYSNGVKVVPDNIYELLTPVALAHLIMGDGVARSYGLQLCTDSYSLSDVVRLMNVLIIRYELVCTFHKKKEKLSIVFIYLLSLCLVYSLSSVHIYMSLCTIKSAAPLLTYYNINKNELKVRKLLCFFGPKKYILLTKSIVIVICVGYSVYSS
jgi:hypothetical protein